jgi:UDP-2,3-diacylglucosamine pyrophosphatase LpxH
LGHKLKFVLSDLHLGAGYGAEKGNLLEDFTATGEFTAFLRMIGQEGERDQREIELIINGDLFEFLQVPAVDVYEPGVSYPKEAYLDASQEASIKRLKLIVQGHEEIFNALSDFMHVESPQRRITLIKGNHDVNLFWPGVKGHLREVLGATGARASLLRFADEFVSRESIYIEHGHQRAEKMNVYNDFFDPRSGQDPNQLYYPAGSRFVIDFFNEVEADYGFVDHIKPITALIWYAFRWDFDLASKATLSFIQHTSTLSELHTDDHARKDTFLSDLEDEQRREEMAQRYTDDANYRRRLHRWLQRYIDSVNLRLKEVSLYPATEISDDPIQMGRASQRLQRLMLLRAAEIISYREGAKVIFFGHTHVPSRESLSSGSIYINTGSWVDDLSEASSEDWQVLFGGAYDHCQTPARLPYARIDYDEHENPTAKLLYFSHEAEVPEAANLHLATSREQPAPPTRFFRQKCGRTLLSSPALRRTLLSSPALRQIVRLLGASGSW